jgi:hypothetical protein
VATKFLTELEGFRMPLSRNDQILKQAFSDFHDLPPENRKTKQDARNFVARSGSKYDLRGPTWTNKEKILALEIIAYQARINEPLEGR